MTRKLTLIQDEDTGFWYIAERTGFSYISISNQATTKLIVSPEDKKYAWNLYAIPEWNHEKLSLFFSQVVGNALVASDNRIDLISKQEGKT